MGTNPFIAALLTALLASTASGADWPQWRGLNRDAKVADFKPPATWPKELAKKWSVPVGDGAATPALVGDKLYVFTREENDAYFCVVDLHSITSEYDPQDLHDRTLDLVALLYAVGLEPNKCTLFLQSHVTGHAEAAWLLSAVTGFGQLGRMTQFKEKGEGKDFVSAGLIKIVEFACQLIAYVECKILPGQLFRVLDSARHLAVRFRAVLALPGSNLEI